MAKKIKQTVIPKQVVDIAKFIQQCDQRKVTPIIHLKRSWGKSEAYRIARNNN